MSAICVITPLIQASWPIITQIATSVATSLGFSIASASLLSRPLSGEEKMEEKKVELEIKNSKIITDSLERKEEVSFTKEGVTATFKKDLRGRCGISVLGRGKSEEELRKIGKELSQKIVQQYVKSKVLEELKQKGYMLSEEEITEEGTIRLNIRKWR